MCDHITISHELNDKQRKDLLDQAAAPKYGKSAYSKMARGIRALLEDLYACDLTHLACEVILLGLRNGELSSTDLRCLAENQVPVGDLLHKEITAAGVFADDCERRLGPPSWVTYSPSDYVAWFERECQTARAVFVRFWHSCKLIVEYREAEGLPVKPTLALMGMQPENLWTWSMEAKRVHGEPGGEDKAHAAVAYEWDLLANPDFVGTMDLALSIAAKDGLSRWTATLSGAIHQQSVRIVDHSNNDGKECLVERPTALQSLLLVQMPLWALLSVSTEEGSSAPVFGLPSRQLKFTAIRPGVWVCGWGVLARLPRYYSFNALRMRMDSDLALLKTAMNRKQPRIGRSLNGAYAYARRIRDELIAAKWKDHQAIQRAQEVSGLKDRQILRVGYRGKGDEHGKGRKDSTKNVTPTVEPTNPLPASAESPWTSDTEQDVTAERTSS